MSIPGYDTRWKQRANKDNVPVGISRYPILSRTKVKWCVHAGNKNITTHCLRHLLLRATRRGTRGGPSRRREAKCRLRRLATRRLRRGFLRRSLRGCFLGRLAGVAQSMIRMGRRQHATLPQDCRSVRPLRRWRRLILNIVLIIVRYRLRSCLALSTCRCLLRRCRLLRGCLRLRRRWLV